jgi:hypothetical protein
MFSNEQVTYLFFPPLMISPTIPPLLFPTPHLFQTPLSCSVTPVSVVTHTLPRTSVPHACNITFPFIFFFVDICGG